MSKILILNGPNLNLLGAREPEIYGHETLADIESQCEEEAESLEIEVEFLQTNSEEEIITAIQDAPEEYSGIVINVAAFSHTSIAIMDALRAIDIPIVEVHLSNIYKREEFRRHSYVSQAADGSICGFGGLGYRLALQAIAELV